MKQAAVYIRVSSKEQAGDDKESLETQETKGKAFIESHGWTFHKLYADRGISGADMEKREALKELLRDAEAGKIQAEFHSRISPVEIATSTIGSSSGRVLRLWSR